MTTITTLKMEEADLLKQIGQLDVSKRFSAKTVRSEKPAKMFGR
jgi:hypothetical protein